MNGPVGTILKWTDAAFSASSCHQPSEGSLGSLSVWCCLNSNSLSREVLLFCFMSTMLTMFCWKTSIHLFILSSGCPFPSRAETLVWSFKPTSSFSSVAGGHFPKVWSETDGLWLQSWQKHTFYVLVAVQYLHLLYKVIDYNSVLVNRSH